LQADYASAAEAAAALTPAPYGPGLASDRVIGATPSELTPAPYGPSAASVGATVPPPPVLGGEAGSALTPPPYGPTVASGGAGAAPPSVEVKPESELTPPPYGPGVTSVGAATPEPVEATDDRSSEEVCS
jgi:hypothetical protein